MCVCVCFFFFFFLFFFFVFFCCCCFFFFFLFVFCCYFFFVIVVVVVSLNSLGNDICSKEATLLKLFCPLLKRVYSKRKKMLPFPSTALSPSSQEKKIRNSTMCWFPLHLNAKNIIFLLIMLQF